MLGGWSLLHSFSVDLAEEQETILVNLIELYRRSQFESLRWYRRPTIMATALTRVLVVYRRVPDRRCLQVSVVYSDPNKESVSTKKPNNILKYFRVRRLWSHSSSSILSPISIFLSSAEVPSLEAISLSSSSSSPSGGHSVSASGKTSSGASLT